MDSGSTAEWFSGIATAAAVVVALGGYWASDWQRRRELRDQERQSGNMIGVKLGQALNRTDDIRRHLWAPYEGTPMGGSDSQELWRVIQPLIGLQDDPTINLNDSEINLLIRANQTKFMMNLMLVIARYQSITSSMKEYAIRYDAIMALTPAPEVMNEKVAVHIVNREQYMKLEPYSNALEMLVTSLRNMSVENVKKANGLAAEFSPIMKAYFKTDKFLSLAVLPILGVKTEAKA